MKYTFQLADRQIRVVGFNPATGETKTEPTYKSNEVYAVPARVTRVVMKKPGNSALSGRVDYQLSVQAAPELSPYKKADVFLVTGVPDGTTAWATNGAIAEVVFLSASNKFADFRRTTHPPK